jgi:hypothetical protein
MKSTTQAPRSTRSFPDPNANSAPNSVGDPDSGPGQEADSSGASAFTLVETVVASFLAAVTLPPIYATTAPALPWRKFTRENHPARLRPHRVGRVVIQILE